MKVINDSALSYIWTKLKNHFQDKLISGTNIKTINNNSLLGSGDITISGGGATNWQNGSATGSVRTSGSMVEYDSYVIGFNATTEGSMTRATGSSSHAEGNETLASGHFAHAEGTSYHDVVVVNNSIHETIIPTLADGEASHAEGIGTTASGAYSHAEGYRTTASGGSSHADGSWTVASGSNAHASGRYTTAQRKSQTVIGEFNALDTGGSSPSTRGDYAFIIGNGTSSSTRSNAYAVEWDGDSTQAGRATTSDMSSADITDFITGLGGLGTLIFDAVYPVGSYYETSDSSFDPNNSFVGTWALEDEGLVHIGSGTNYTIGATGGEKTHKLTSSESGLPNHRHLDCGGGYNVHDAGSWASRTAPANQTGNTPFINSQTYTSYSSADASLAHNNMQPYVVVNRWHRTA